MAGALFLAALVANCFRGAFPPVDLRAVCFVRAIAAASSDEQEARKASEVNCVKTDSRAQAFEGSTES